MYLSPRSLSGRVSAAASSTPSHGAGRSTPRAAPPVDAEGYEDEISRLLGSIGLTDSPSSRSGLVSSGTPRSHGATGAEGGLPPPPKPLYGATLARSAATSYGVRHVDDDDDEGEESAGLLPRADYIPFIHPNKEAAHKELPASTTPASYLSAVRNNILAEYACFLKEARPEAYYLITTREDAMVTSVLELEAADRDDTHRGYDSTLTLKAPDGTESSTGKKKKKKSSAAGGGENGLKELHQHLLINQGCLAVAVLKKGKLELKQGSEWSGKPIPRISIERSATMDLGVVRMSDILFDLGYIGDAANELASCMRMIETYNNYGSAGLPTLLQSVADPKSRQLVSYRSPPAHELSLEVERPVPINQRQMDTLAGLRYDVEGIQGPPGTGKSTVILHAIRTFLPQASHSTGQAERVLATCVQNKAVDAIAEKLGKANTRGAADSIPFFVFGSEDRLGLVSRLWTLEAQVERDPRVVAIDAAKGRFAAMYDIVSKAVRKGRSRLDNSKRHQEFVRATAIRKFGYPDRSLSLERREAIQMKIDAYTATNPWSRAWSAVWDHLHPELVWTRRYLRRFHEELELEAAAMRVQARKELIANARAVLCTVATASRSLLTTEELVPVASRITTAILDEAGTCPESKLPLLLMLPQLKRIVAIGDEQQLSPFSHWNPFSGDGGGGAGGAGSPRSPPGVCNLFSQTGRCRFGSSCKYRHVRTSAGFRSPTKSAGGLTEAPRGFFQRLKAALPSSAVPSLLDQYRMHPNIAAYVSATIYQGTLRTPREVAAARTAADPQGLYWLDYRAMPGGSEQKPQRSKSTINPQEVQLALQVYKQGEAEGYLCTPKARLVAGARGGMRRVTTKGRSVAVITLYKAQEFQLRQYFEAHGITEREVDPAEDTSGLGSFRILTVDQAQGSEADVVILSLVRSNDARSLGFAKNKNRLNVAVSRAKERLVVIGDIATMGTDPLWRALAGSCTRINSADELPAMADNY